MARAMMKLRHEVAASVEREPEPDWVGRSQQRRLGAAQLAQMVQDYEGGVGSTTLAVRYGVSETGVLCHLHRAGANVRPRGKLSEDDVVLAQELREAGWTYRAIGDRFGVSRTAIKLRLDRRRR